MGKNEGQEENHQGPSSHNTKKQQCFVGHSHKAPWHDDIISACEETLPKFGLQPWYADDQFEPTKSLRDKVVEMIANARYGLYDLSWYQPDEQSPWKMPQNVLIELGMAIALNRPVLLLRHAENRALGLSLPTCLDSISQRIVEFSGGPTLKHALEERIPQWLDVPPERAWWMRYCLFGERICTYRESYPQIIQCGQKTIGCHIADGKDIDRPDFRSVIEDELGRYSDISFDYLDALLPTVGYDFQLCTYCQIVRSTPFAIYRITPETTADTFIAIGISIALEKQFKCEIPKFLFTTDARSVPSLLTGYEVVEARTAKERQACLRKFIPMVMRKVREYVWKPKQLPFVEFLAQSTETISPEKDQPLFSEANEEDRLSGDEEHMGKDELVQDTDNPEMNDAMREEDARNILVDGYNVIKNNLMFRAMETKSLAESRNLLIRQLQNRYRHTIHRVIVVFDGDGKREQVCHEEHILIIYSLAGETAGSVLKRLSAEARAVGRPVEMYSDDEDVRQTVVEQGGTIQTTGHLMKQVHAAPRDVAIRSQHRIQMRRIYGIDTPYKLEDELEGTPPSRRKKNKRSSRNKEK
jgi:predicted RNA-binding protein with PIN domain